MFLNYFFSPQPIFRILLFFSPFPFSHVFWSNIFLHNFFSSFLFVSRFSYFFLPHVKVSPPQIFLFPYPLVFFLLISYTFIFSINIFQISLISLFYFLFPPLTFFLSSLSFPSLVLFLSVFPSFPLLFLFILFPFLSILYSFF